MMLGSAFHIVTFSLFQVLIYIHDALQIPSVASTGQLEVQWEDVSPTVGNSTAQGTLWNPRHPNVANYGTADYPELASVSNHDDVHICTIDLPNLLATQQSEGLANRYPHPYVGPAHRQGIPGHMQVIFHVSANLSSLYMFLIEFIAAGESSK